MPIHNLPFPVLGARGLFGHLANWQVAPSKAGLLSACDSGQGDIRTYHLKLEVGLED
jgi:hypothetical protein